MIKSGDICLVGGSGIVSSGITFFTNNCIDFNPTHAEVIVKVFQQNPPLFDVVSADDWMVTLRGVRKKELKNCRIITPPKPFTKRELQDVLNFCFSTIGKDYDTWGMLGNAINAADELQKEDAWFCSEHAFTAWFKGNRLLLENILACFVTPRDIYISTNKKLVYSSEHNKRR